MISISDAKMEKKNNQERSAGIPEETDEGEPVTTFPHSHAASRNWLSPE
jgi:hypothetical protein